MTEPDSEKNVLPHSRQPGHAPSPMLSGRSLWLAIGSIACLSLLACLPTLHTYFLGDDYALLHSFCHLSPGRFLQLMHMDEGMFVWGDVRHEYRPLYSLFYVAGYHLWGLHVWGYHLCEIGLHAVVTILIFLIAKQLVPDKSWRAWFAAALFLVQPLHAQATSLIVGAVAECLPAIFYLSAFLYFIRFRRERLSQDLAISSISFFFGLLTKESAVTLPAMLVSYDVLCAIMHKRRPAFLRQLWEQRRKYFAPYLPYIALLSAYLAWRRKVLSSYVEETEWAAPALNAPVISRGFWMHAVHFAANIWQLQVFNLHTFLPYPWPVLALLTCLLLYLLLALWLRRRDCKQSVAIALYFCIAWYLITTAPLLIEGHVTYHMYLPASGICIGIAHLIFPVCGISKARLRFTIFFATLFLLLALALTWKEDAQYADFGRMSSVMSAQLAASLETVPQGQLALIIPADSALVASGWGENLVPFSMQPPFTNTDLYSRIHVIEHPDMSCCGPGEWWQKIRPALQDEMTGPENEDISIAVLLWDEKDSDFRTVTRILPRKTFARSIVSALGGPPQAIDDLGNLSNN